MKKLNVTLRHIDYLLEYNSETLEILMVDGCDVLELEIDMIADLRRVLDEILMKIFNK